MAWGQQPPSSGLLVPALILLLSVLTTPAFGQTDPSDPCFTQFTNSQGDDDFSQIIVEFSENDQDRTPQEQEIFRSLAVQLSTTDTTEGSPPFDDHFAFEPRSNGYALVLTVPIDRDGTSDSQDDDLSILSYQIRCQSSATQFYFKNLRIIINDINDNPPRFIGAPYMGTVNELTPVGLTVLTTISATDLDEANNKAIIYSLSDTPGAEFQGGSQKFYLPSDQDGIVAVREQLDFESMYRAANFNLSRVFYAITVTARDNAQPPATQLSNQASLTLYITDGNDLGPEFVYASCEPSIQNPSKQCVHARYLTSIPSGEPVSQQLTFTAFPQLPSNAVTDIIMQDRDTLNFPIQCSVHSTTPSGYENYFSTRAEQIGTTKQYRCLVSTNTASGVLNRNVLQSLQITIEAAEVDPTASPNQRRVDYATITATVTQVNNNIPRIDSNSIIGYIPENSPKFTQVGADINMNSRLKLTFVDPDLPNAQNTDFDVNISPANVPFTLTDDGYLQVSDNGLLDFETTPSYNFRVTITERTPEQNQAFVDLTVNVLNVNDVPPVFAAAESYLVQVPAGDYSTPTGSRVLVPITATDAENDALTYSIVRVMPSGNDAKFTLTNTGGGNEVLVLRGQVAAGEVYSVTVQASDSVNTATVDVVVDVLAVQVLSPPTFTSQRYTIFVSEGTLPNTELFLIPASDADTPLDDLTYLILSTSPTPLFGTQYFSLANNALVNNIVFDRESTPEYNVTVQVRDPDNLTGQTIVTVRVTDVNDNAPIFIGGPYSFSIREGEAIDTPIGTPIQATDIDEGLNGLITYSIDNTLDSTFFNIDRTSGQIFSRAVFDYETRNLYNIVVLASDQGSSPRTAATTVQINILDVQDSVPTFEEANYQRSVQEGQLGVNVITLRATDDDTTKAFNFILEDVPGFPTESTSFSLEGNGPDAIIRTNVALDYETKNLYRFQVTTQDGQGSGVTFSTATVTVTVLDINDNAPVVGQYDTNERVLENVDVGTLIEQIQASDPDTSFAGEVRYTKGNVNPVPSRPIFGVGYTDGRLTVASSLEAERTNDVFTVEIIASDLGVAPNRDTATVTVTIVRNFAPQFPSATQTINPRIRGDASEFDRITQVVATDANDPTTPQFASVRYRFDGVGNAPSFFNIGPTDGAVTLAQIINLDPTEVYTLNIIAEDLGGLTATMELVVPIERNLFAPVWSTPSPVEPPAIPENFALGSPIVRVGATDSDVQSPWNQLFYTLVVTPGSEVDRLFQIDGTGQISLKQSLTTSTASQYDMSVEVRDGGTTLNPSRAAATRAQVTITVNRNEFDPIFFNETYRISVSEDLGVGQQVIDVQARDNDNVFNNLQYFLLGTYDALDYFELDPTFPGRIRVKTALTGAPLNDYTIAVQARDNGSPPREGNAFVYVHITRNLAIPVWNPNQRTSVSVQEDILTGTPFATITTTTTSGYRITSGSDRFQINSLGEISARQPIYLDNASQYNLVLQAYNLQDESIVSSDYFLTVFPIRNEFAPVFQGVPYIFDVNLPLSDNQLIGFVSATDADPQIFNRITFSTANYALRQNLFTVTVDPNNANRASVFLVSGNSINLSSANTFRFYAVAEDNGAIPKADIAVVTVNVNRNQNAPS